MLTSDLLVTRTYRGRIEPVYAPLSQENLEIAGTVIDLFQGHMGKTYGELSEELAGFEEINYRLIRGLAQILERRCLIEVDSVIDPAAARRAVFEESGGLVTGREEREMVLEKAAERLSASSPTPIRPEDLEKALWADHEGNLVIKEFQAIAPGDLLRHYNLSLAQTLLFRAIGMEIQLEDGYQNVFWKIKQLGLMYSIIDGKIYLDGPISIFKLTEKYGTALSKLLPAVVMARRWSIKASILRKTPQGKRVYDFSLDHKAREILGPGQGDGAGSPVSFDSAVEKEFYHLSFNGWTVRREPAVLRSGQYAFIPDFSLERNGTRIYVEIIGFWTSEYLKNKIEKINRLDDRDGLLLLVNRNLACSGSEFNTDNLIFYEKKIPHLEIIKFLRRHEERQKTEEVARLKDLDLKDIDISLDGSMDVIGLDEAARRHGVSLEALREVIKGRDNAGYLLLGDQLVSDQIMEKISGELVGVKKHDDAVEVFRRHGIKARSQALESLGYRVKWNGLDPEDAEILKT